MTQNFSFHLLFISIVAGGCLTSCGTKKEIIIDPLPEKQHVEFSTVGKGVLYGAGEEGIERGNLVIRTASEWESVQKKMDAVNEVTNKFGEEEIDFNANILIACFDEVRPNGGYGLKIKDVSESQSRIEVSIELTEPVGDNTSVMIQPFHIIKIPANEKEVVFEEYSESQH